jgi:hypothetical protein
MHGLPAEEHVNHAGKDEEARVSEVDVSVPADWATGTHQPLQDRPVTRPQEFGSFVLTAAMGVDLSQEAIDQLPGITWFDPHTGVGKDRVLPADQVPAREARLIAGDLDVSARFVRHDQITSSLSPQRSLRLPS